MIVTEHGRTDKLYKGVTVHNGQRLTFFGISRAHVFRKELEWIDKNMEPLNQAQKARPVLRVIEGGRV